MMLLLVLVLWLVAGALLGAGIALVGRRAIPIAGGKLVIVVLAFTGMGMLVTLGIGVFHYSSLKGRELEARRGWNLVPVVVASVDLTPGQPIVFDVISQRSIPEQFVTDDMVPPDAVTKIVNTTLAAPLAQGDVLLWNVSCSAATPAPARTP
jgi:Flp pilus assembly protein CpaB